MLLRLLAVSAFTAGCAASVLAVDLTAARSMPPAEVSGPKQAAVVQFLTEPGLAHRVMAEPFTESQQKAQRRTDAAANRAKPVQIGFPRSLPPSARSVPLAALAWQTTADGGRAARLAVQADGAAALRVGYRLQGPADAATLRFGGSARAEVHAATITTSTDTQWSPVLEGAEAALELHLKAGHEPHQFTLELTGLSHLKVAPGNFADHQKVLQIGDSESCNIDIACEGGGNSALLAAAKATAKMVFTDAGKSYLCTGTLLNANPVGNYLYTAAHCISSQATAATLNTYWFFDAVACNSLAVPAYQLVTGGANLLVTDPTLDGTLLQLRDSPPVGAVRAAWNATVFNTGSPLVGIHHASGDLKKFSVGAMQGYVQGPASYDGVPRPQAGKDSFISVRWSRGTTEEGSSGSGVFTYNPSGYYELRGGLEGGAASCGNPTGADRFSRLDLLFTRLAPYLNPAAIIPTTNPAGVASMVEFYNPQFDFYFISSKEDEKSVLDTLTDAQANRLWYRTGYWFRTDSLPSSQTSSITRYFMPGAARSGTRGSHFYTAVNADRLAITATGKERTGAACATMPNQYYCNEGIDSFVATPVGSGANVSCLSGEQPIYRVFRGEPRFVDDGNHRYLTDTAMYGYMVNDLGWSGEGIAFCARAGG